MALGTRARILLTFGIVGGVVGAGIAYYTVTAPRRADVVASFYPYSYMAARIGGGEVTVMNLVPAGVEPHDWELTPSAIAQIHASDVFVYNGYVETYLGALFAELPADRPARVNTSAGLAVRTTANGEVDPHVWLDPVLAGSIVDSIEAALSAARPASASVFQANAQRLRADLAGIHSDYGAGLQTCALRTIVTQHEAFGYVAARYDLTIVAIQGLSPDTEPTPQQLAEIRAVINQTGVRYIFYEELVDPRIAQTLAQEAGVDTMVLDPIEGLSAEGAQQGRSYLTIAEQNLGNLRVALQCT